MEYSAVRGIIVPCRNNLQLRSPEGRFQAAETELKLRGGFKPFSIVFAQLVRLLIKVNQGWPETERAIRQLLRVEAHYRSRDRFEEHLFS